MSSAPEQAYQAMQDAVKEGTQGRTYTSVSWDEDGTKTVRTLGGGGQ